LIEKNSRLLGKPEHAWGLEQQLILKLCHQRRVEAHFRLASFLKLNAYSYSESTWVLFGNIADLSVGIEIVN
jgi:hypothetical protein